MINFHKNSINKNSIVLNRAGHATWFCFATTAMQQRDNVIEQQGQRKTLRRRCLNVVATPNIDIRSFSTIFALKKMGKLSQQCCRVPSSSCRGSVVACPALAVAEVLSRAQL